MRKLILSAATLSLLFVASSVIAQSNAGAPSLAEAARKAHATRKTKTGRVWTNDDFSSPVIAAPPANAKDAKGAAAQPVAASEPGAAATEAKPGSPAEKATALKAEWKSKVDAQRKVIADLEADGAKGDTQLQQRSSAAYSDLGVRLRNEQQYVADDTKIRDDAGKRQDKLAAAKADLDKMLEDARKAGVEGSLD
jgi:hypothetical protein